MGSVCLAENPWQWRGEEKRREDDNNNGFVFDECALDSRTCVSREENEAITFFPLPSSLYNNRNTCSPSQGQSKFTYTQAL